MFDDEKVEQTQDIQPEEQLQAEVAQPEVQQPVQEQPKESPAERNFRALEQKMRRIERERDEALRLAESHKQAQNNDEIDEEISIGADDIAEGKHVKALAKQIAQMKSEIKQYKQASTTMSAEAMLKAQYPDIEKVVTKENLDSLRDADPEFAEMLDTSTSFRAKAISAYKHIKKLGLYTEDNFMAEREQAQKNAHKPKPLTSVSPQQGDSPLSRANAFANGLTPELQKQLREEMEQARKNR